MTQPVPTQLTDMDQTVDAPQIDERAELLQAPHDTFAQLSHFESASKLVLASAFSRSQHSATAEHQVALVGTGLRNHAGEFLSHELTQVLDAIERHLAGRNKSTQAADLAFQSALIVTGDAGLDDHSLGHLRPICHRHRSAGQAHLVQTFGRVETARRSRPVRRRPGAVRQSRATQAPPGDAPPRSTKTLSR